MAISANVDGVIGLSAILLQPDSHRKSACRKLTDFQPRADGGELGFDLFRIHKFCVQGRALPKWRPCFIFSGLSRAVAEQAAF
jgi:hypothetical protein